MPPTRSDTGMRNSGLNADHLMNVGSKAVDRLPILSNLRNRSFSRVLLCLY